VHSKDLWVVLIWHLFDVQLDLSDLFVFWNEVGSLLGELVVGHGDDLVVLEDGQDEI
jgi:hypothetical protein